MYNFAAMYYISRRTGHRIIFLRENVALGRGLQLHLHFHNLPLELVSIESLSKDEQMCLTFPLDRVVVDSRIFQLDPGFNYNFIGLFSSYKCWYSVRAEIADLYAFDTTVLVDAAKIVEQARVDARQVVAVHVRRTDYLTSGHINLTRDYYEAAFEQFDDSSVNYLFFSDDIPWCRENFAKKPNIYYAEGASAIVDMAAMSLCDHNVIANSTFSFWSAFLNRNAGRRVICPAKILKRDDAIPYLNYAWYPDEFIGLDVGNV
jgi:hypothetical protein